MLLIDILLGTFWEAYYTMALYFSLESHRRHRFARFNLLG